MVIRPQLRKVAVSLAAAAALVTVAVVVPAEASASTAAQRPAVSKVQPGAATPGARHANSWDW